MSIPHLHPFPPPPRNKKYQHGFFLSDGCMSLESFVSGFIRAFISSVIIQWLNKLLSRAVIFFSLLCFKFFCFASYSFRSNIYVCFRFSSWVSPSKLNFLLTYSWWVLHISTNSVLASNSPLFCLYLIFFFDYLKCSSPFFFFFFKILHWFM